VKISFIFRSKIEWTEDVRDENQPPSFLQRNKNKLPITIQAALENLKMMPSHLKELLKEFCEVKFFNHYLYKLLMIFSREPTVATKVNCNFK